MTLPDRPPPEIPPPDVPGAPEPGAPPAPPIPRVPLVTPPDADHDDVLRGLRAHRRLLLTGRLDDATVERVCAELMLLDGRSSEPVHVLITGPGGPVETVLALLDVLSLMRAPVATRCVGPAVGTTAVVLASGTGGRSAAARASIQLRIADASTVEGRADDITRDARRVSDLWNRLAAHVADVSHLTVGQAAHALRDGGHMTADEARTAGLIDEVVAR